MPWKLKFATPKRFWFTASSGLAHQSTIQVSSPPIAMATIPTSPSFAASQRFRVTLWVQTRRKVPVSSSRAMSGAPKKSPTSAGTMATMKGKAPCSGPVQVEHRVRRRGAVPCGLARDLESVIHMREVRTRDCEHNRHDTEPDRADEHVHGTA